LLKALVDQVAGVVRIELAAEDLLGDAGGQPRALLIDLANRLLAGGLDIAQGALLEFFAFLLRVAADLGGDLLALERGLAEHVAHLLLGRFQPRRILFERFLGLEPRRFGVGYVPADAFLAGLEAGQHLFPGRGVEHPQQHQEDGDGPDGLVPVDAHDVPAFFLAGRGFGGGGGRVGG